MKGFCESIARVSILSGLYITAAVVEGEELEYFHLMEKWIIHHLHIAHRMWLFQGGLQVFVPTLILYMREI